MVYSHIIGAFRVIPMTSFLDPTCNTIVANFHALSMGPSVFSNVVDVFTAHPLGFCLTLSFYRCSGPLLFATFACCSWWVKAATVAVRSAIVLLWIIMVSLPAADAVSRLMRASWVPSISLRLFDPWYPPVRVDIFCFLLNSRCAA